MSRLEAIAAACRAARQAQQDYFVIRAEDGAYTYCTAEALEIFYPGARPVFSTCE